MNPEIELSGQDREILLKTYQDGPNAPAARRANMILLLSNGWSVEDVCRITFAEEEEVAEAVRRFRQEGVEGLVQET